MKKAAVISIFLIISGTCFAQNIENIDTLITAGLDENYLAIQEEAANLNDKERAEIYYQYKKDNWLGGFVNLIPNLLIFNNFGIGNFIQGDEFGGTITLTGNLTGIGLVLYGFLDQRRVNNSIRGDIVTISPFFIFGMIFMEAFSIYGTVRAFIYPITYNNKLRTALQFDQVTVDIEPSLSVTNKNYELTLARITY